MWWCTSRVARRRDVGMPEADEEYDADRVGLVALPDLVLPRVIKDQGSPSWYARSSSPHRIELPDGQRSGRWQVSSAFVEPQCA